MASSLVDQFLAKTSTATAAALAGLTPSYTSDGKVVVDCPFCKSEMFITSGDFLCSNKCCSFRSGNPVDFTAGIVGSYRKATVDLYQAEGHKNLPPHEELTVRAFENNRKLTKLVLKSLNNLSPTRNSEIIGAEGWLRKNNLDISSLRGYAFIWTKEEVGQLNHILGQMDRDEEVLLDSGFFLVIPYFCTYSSVGALMLIKKGIKEPRVLKFSHEKFMWAGLGNLTSPPPETKVTQNFALMLKMIQRGRLSVDLNTPTLGLMFNPKSVDTGLIPGEPVYIHHPDLDVNMSAVSSLAQAYQDLEVLSVHSAYTEENKTPWSKYIVRYLCESMTDQVINDQSLHYLDSCRLGNHQKERLIQDLTFRGEGGKAKRLANHFGSEVIAETDRLRIRSSSGGYFSQDQKNGSRADITNFTLKILRNVVFSDRKEVLTECEVQFGGVSSKIFIPTQNLDNPAKIEESARLAWISVASGENTLPVVKDKALFRKYVANYLKDETSRALTVTGISQIGWSYDRKKFQGPGWAYDADGKKVNESILHGDLEFLSCYSTAKVEKIFTTKCPQDLKDGLAMVMANFVRASLGLKCLPVMYDSTPEARSLLENLMRGLGQVSPYNGLLRNGAPDGCKDVPFMVTGSNFGFANLSLPVFCCSPDGNVVVKPGEDYSIAAGMVQHVVELALDRFFTDGLKWFKPVHSTDNSVSLMLEGAWIIKRLTGKEWEVSCQRKKLDELLDQIPLENIGDVFELDIKTQSVVIRTDKIPGGDALIRELSVDYEITDTGDWGAKVGMVDVSRLLRNFYHTASVSYGRFKG